MSNIIQFSIVNSELKEVRYTELYGDFGVGTKDQRLDIYKLGRDEFVVEAGKEKLTFDRESLAEFLWVAALFIDSEQKWLPKVEFIGCDY